MAARGLRTDGPRMEKYSKPERRPSLIAAEHMALNALGAYDAEPVELPPEKSRPLRAHREEFRLLRLALLPLAGWAGGVLLGLPAEETLYAVLVAGFLAIALGFALRR